MCASKTIPFDFILKGYSFDDVYDNNLYRDVMIAILLATIVNFIVLIIIVRVAKTYIWLIGEVLHMNDFYK